MSDQNETIAAILAEMRGNEFDDPHIDADGIIGARRLARDWADRIEAAAKRERIELREDEAKMLLREYAAAPDESLTPSALELKRELLRLAPAPGNAAAMREALERIAALRPALGGFVEPIDGDSSAIYQNARWNGKEFLGKEIPACWGAKWRNDLANAIDTARAAIATPARNVDRPFRSVDEAIGAYVAERGDGPHLGYCDAIKWALAPAEGEAK